MIHASATLRFARGIWGEAALLYWHKIALTMVIVTIASALDLFDAVKDGRSSNLQSFIWTYVAASVHNTLINKSNALIPKFVYVLGVGGAWIAMTIPGMLAMLTLAITLHTEEIEVPVTTAAFLIATLGVTSFFGTLVPSVVAGREQQTIGKAVARGKIVFGYTLARLAILLCTVLAAIFAFDTALSALDQSSNWNGMTADVLAPVNIFVTVMSNLATAYFFVLLSVILSRSYLIAERQLGEMQK